MGSEEYLKTDLGSGLCMSSTWKEVNQGQAQLPEKNEPDLSTLKQIFKLGANEKEDKQTKAYCLLLKPENIGAACPCDVIICPPESKHIQIKCLFVRSTAKICEVYLDGKYVSTFKGEHVEGEDGVFTQAITKPLLVSERLVIRFLSLRGEKKLLKLHQISVQFSDETNSHDTDNKNGGNIFNGMQNRTTLSSNDTSATNMSNTFMLLGLEKRVTNTLEATVRKIALGMEAKIQKAVNEQFEKIDERLHRIEVELRDMKSIIARKHS
mmetsp:Transcript_5744/g.7258  ORF Transcript_5744/g.7258 Transcript_5744/m.7258 type:complete len:267 (+) Transcript_5744:514-1314(+)|eukprot:CAMPEP_0204830462 /NCGR_PEP_ID=MMETSP1346-20131115/8651_1 /ASSEMBLY_ACC=CAM_ASM_000771 /TAXON_ID=215587 /ORGANISM="Aplanochytrium stocchinoi, Strain GSBS06" /LENGTH=266 /DNA_ID=CAMNT_0051960725 /DNA_START=412 /DNA_END=1212 /DNA_ORIENTATION=-